MASSGMLGRVALVRTDISEELSATFIRATRSVVPSSPILVTLMKEGPSSSETSVLKRATRRNIPEGDILHSYRREYLKSYRGTGALEMRVTHAAVSLSTIHISLLHDTLPGILLKKHVCLFTPAPQKSEVNNRLQSDI
jgi:hypothetical protein